MLKTPLKMKANFIGNKKIDKKILREMLSQAKPSQAEMSGKVWERFRRSSVYLQGKNIDKIGKRHFV